MRLRQHCEPREEAASSPAGRGVVSRDSNRACDAPAFSSTARLMRGPALALATIVLATWSFGCNLPEGPSKTTKTEPVEKAEVSTITVHPTADWPMEGHDSGWTSHSTVRLTPPLKTAWELNLGGGWVTSLLAKDGSVYALIGGHVGDKGTLFAIDSSTKKVRWQRNLPPGETHAALAKDAILCSLSRYVEAKQETIATLGAYSTTDGKPVWTYEATGSTMGFLVSQDVAYLQVQGQDKGFIAAIDVESGKEKQRLGTGSDERILAVAGDVIYTDNRTQEEGEVSTVTARLITKKVSSRRDVMWERATPGMLAMFDTDGQTACYASSVSEDASNPARLDCVDARTGERLWEGRYPYHTQLVAMGEGRVIVARSNTSQGSVVEAIDARSGKKQWSYTGPAKLPLFQLIVTPNAVYGMAGTELEFNYFDGVLLALDLGSGKQIWNKKLGTLVSHLIIAEGALYCMYSPDAKVAAHETGGNMRVMAFK